MTRLTGAALSAAFLPRYGADTPIILRSGASWFMIIACDPVSPVEDWLVIHGQRTGRYWCVRNTDSDDACDTVTLADGPDLAVQLAGLDW